MPRFVAAHSVPFTEDILKKYAREEAPKFSKKKVTWLRTYCDFEDNKHFCEWEAPKKEAIEEIFKEHKIPFDSIYKFRLFYVSKEKLEK